MKQPTKLNRWVFLLALVSGLGSILFCTYGKWERLTAAHGTELKTVLEQSVGSVLLSRPCFFKVIAYSHHKADAFMVEDREGEQDAIVHFERNEQGQWTIPRYDLCTVANGSPTCFFPWYDPERAIKGQLSVGNLPFDLSTVPKADCQQKRE